MTTGAVHCWGDNSYGQLGIGTVDANGKVTPSSSPVPTQVPGIDNAMDDSAGDEHSCIVTKSGQL